MWFSDVDECELDPTLCTGANGGECLNDPGGNNYTCVCDVGFLVSPEASTSTEVVCESKLGGVCLDGWRRWWSERGIYGVLLYALQQSPSLSNLPRPLFLEMCSTRWSCLPPLHGAGAGS